MITNKELSEVTLSPTKKDYYQIWNELMELADKISERWSPASTNESDPGIVLLKALTAVADKLNYNIDKNTLEAFMPSATQEDSMRKLTEMMGYDMKHYQSATTKALITYKGSNEAPLSSFSMGIYFPKFINLKNEDEDINYVTLEDFTLQPGQDSREVAIIEGEVIECETNTDNIITPLHLDDSNRYILPEYAIAENGIFITNITDSVESQLWRKEQNLNVQQPGSKIYKFGFDSALQLPYIQFPEDIKTLIEDGIKIRYIRTNGLNGNISAKVLSKLEKPALWSTADEDNIKDLSADNFIVSNNSAATNGADPESLNAAYNNYKKTIGTFDTLVTCRDYMNKIYQMTESDIDTTPLVSNIIVSDIRDDINRSTPVSTFNEYGICYKDASLLDTEAISLPLSSGSGYATVNVQTPKIEHFDLVLYPFKTIYGLNNITEYKNSFKYSPENLTKIESELALNKTIAHNIRRPIVGKDDADIACIKNYLQLKARITTIKKVTSLEEEDILKNIYKAIYANFNSRQVDFGEEIPYESLLEVIQNADYRIKDVSLDEPLLNTKFCLTNDTEEVLSSPDKTELRANKLYNKLALRNVLAGKIAAFEYDTDFISEYNKTTYPGITLPDSKIKSIVSHFNVNQAFINRAEDGELKLKENEVIQFRLPSFKTTKTYPAYVNYYLHVENSVGDPAIPATFKTLSSYLASNGNWNSFVNSFAIKPRMEQLPEGLISDEATFNEALGSHEAIFKLEGTNYTKTVFDEEVETYYYLPISRIGNHMFTDVNEWIRSQDSLQVLSGEGNETTYAKLKGLYRTTGIQNLPAGKLIDADLFKYLPAYQFHNSINNADLLNNIYVQDTRNSNDPKEGTADGLGRDSSAVGISKDSEYKLKPNEYLLINYTDVTTDSNGTERKTVVNKIYKEGDIIRANFDLVDSATYHNNHSYSKKDGFYFAGYNSVEGMFTLGTNEQIEIRDLVTVELEEDTVYLYWSLNSDNPDEIKNKFIFNESFNGVANVAYTLKEGEKLYYTNSKKQDLVYYGAGTVVVKSNPNLELYKYGDVSEEKILTYGLAAGIPWQPYDLSSNGNGKLTIIEYQYISLTEGDYIISLDRNTPSDAVSNQWTTLREAEYRFAESSVNTTLPPVSIENLQWEVRSRLDFNMSKSTAQPLNIGDSLDLIFIDDSTASLVAQNNLPIYVNSNYVIQSATDSFQVPVKLEQLVDIKLKLSSKNTPRVANSEGLALNNYVNGDAKYTKFNFENMPVIEVDDFETWSAKEENLGKTEEDYNVWKDSTERYAFTLNTNLDSALYGLMAVYYVQDIDEVVGEESYIIATNGSEDNREVVAGLSLFNIGASESPALVLKQGLNIIKVATSVRQLEVFSDKSKKSSIVFGALDLVKGINPKLDYRVTGSYTGDNALLDQLLADIRDSGVASDFYYNIPIQRASEIDLNASIEDDLLSSPLTWYDPNNVNRKFVISEIDADYLTTGIKLTKASRA